MSHYMNFPAQLCNKTYEFQCFVYSVADEGDAHLATLWSKLFKYQLELGHNDAAYTAMVANPDPSRRKDCLRQLLVS